MKKTILLLIAIVSFVGCSKDDGDANNIARIVLTTESASRIEITPIDGEGFNDSLDEKVYEDVNSVVYELPSYTYSLHVQIQGGQREWEGYIEINGIKQEFSVIDWVYRGAFYMSDFD